jgi:hypothetical protein
VFRGIASENLHGMATRKGVAVACAQRQRIVKSGVN